MSVVGEFIENVVGGALREVLRKTTGATGKRRRRRRAANTSSATLRKIEKLLKPKAKRQVSRRRTARARSKAKRRAS